jgi:hypothetical protein
MTGLLAGGLRSEIGLDPDIRDLMLPCTLTRLNKTPIGGRWTNGTTVTVNALGFLDMRRNAVMIGGSVQADPERIAVILGLDATGAVVPEPRPMDRLLIQGETHGVRTVERDPAGATWTLTLTEVGAAP